MDTSSGSREVLFVVYNPLTKKEKLDPKVISQKTFSMDEKLERSQRRNVKRQMPKPQGMRTSLLPMNPQRAPGLKRIRAPPPTPQRKFSVIKKKAPQKRKSKFFEEEAEEEEVGFYYDDEYDDGELFDDYDSPDDGEAPPLPQIKPVKRPVKRLKRK